MASFWESLLLLLVLIPLLLLGAFLLLIGLGVSPAEFALLDLAFSRSLGERGLRPSIVLAIRWIATALPGWTVALLGLLMLVATPFIIRKELFDKHRVTTLCRE